nr:immunoglobulin heavy chain junction region [Mus musculus]MBK4197120.1 immunoglobulin heavy chain junction region [Mus musculus]
CAIGDYYVSPYYYAMDYW